MASRPTSPHLVRPADMLWLERRLLEVLLLALVPANLVLAADGRRFVGRPSPTPPMARRPR